LCTLPKVVWRQYIDRHAITTKLVAQALAAWPFEFESARCEVLSQDICTRWFLPYVHEHIAIATGTRRLGRRLPGVQRDHLRAD
jgi:hypothetical protein